MLRYLSIRHFAIVEQLELDFEAGFTAITGETGAGKSILVDAMGLLLGDRADSGLIAAGQDQAELSARFELADPSAARDWLAEQALSDGDELLIRRLLGRGGPSRAWINGRPVTIGQLAELGELLVEIHGQHEHQRLGRAETQRQLLDQQVEPVFLDQVRDRWQSWRNARQALTDFEADSGDAAQQELLRFQCQELEELALAEGEFQEMELEQERLARSDEVRSALTRASALLDQDDQPSVRGLVLEALQALSGVRTLDAHLDAAAALLEEARINVDEAIAELERHDDDGDIDPARLDRINRRLQKALDLARKHRVDPERLPALALELRTRLDKLEDQDQERQRLAQALSTALADWQTSADRLRQARQQAADTLQSQVAASLKRLGMDRARLQILVERDSALAPSPHGQDRISILFSANPGQPPQSIGRVASGGELSRVSLALMIAARPHDGPTVRVFDEVDAGIGGETAAVVGRFLKQVADQGQAFCVTHLAQVAACADQQVRVSKRLGEDSTQLEVVAMDAGQRKREIARMLGNPDSKRSLAHASELLAAGKA